MNLLNLKNLPRKKEKNIGIVCSKIVRRNIGKCRVLSGKQNIEVFFPNQLEIIFRLWIIFFNVKDGIINIYSQCRNGVINDFSANWNQTAAMSGSGNDDVHFIDVLLAICLFSIQCWLRSLKGKKRHSLHMYWYSRQHMGLIMWL